MRDSVSGRPTKTPAAPRGVAISGIVFALLYVASLAVVRASVPAEPNDPGAWIAHPTIVNRLRFALGLTPLAGIAFLWFMGAIRNRVGELEDQFFSTVFLGSGIVFVTTLYVAASMTMGLLEAFSSGVPERSDAYHIGRATVYWMMHAFVTKASAVFMFMTSTIGRRTGRLSAGVCLLGYGCGLVMLAALTQFAWIVLLFPLWVLAVGLSILRDG